MARTLLPSAILAGMLAVTSAIVTSADELSDAERSDGFVSIFDGKSLDGWQGATDLRWGRPAADRQPPPKFGSGIGSKPGRSKRNVVIRTRMGPPSHGSSGRYDAHGRCRGHAVLRAMAARFRKCRRRLGASVAA
jgi:hypothetical protein